MSRKMHSFKTSLENFLTENKITRELSQNDKAEFYLHLIKIVRAYTRRQKNILYSEIETIFGKDERRMKNNDKKS